MSRQKVELGRLFHCRTYRDTRPTCRLGSPHTPSTMNINFKTVKLIVELQHLKEIRDLFPGPSREIYVSISQKSGREAPALDRDSSPSTESHNP